MSALKFQDLEVDVTYTVVGYKHVNGKFGDSYLLQVVKDSIDDIIQAWSSKTITDYIKQEKNAKQFVFVVRLIRGSGKLAGQKYADIIGFDGGFTKLE